MTGHATEVPPLKILIVTHNYPRFADDPAGAFVRRLAEGAARAGHTVWVVAPHAAGLPASEERAGVVLRRFRYAPDALETVAYRGDLHTTPLFSAMALLGVPAFLVAFAGAIRRAVRELGPDVVHAHWWLPGGWLSVGRGVPTVITCHGSDIRILRRAALLRTAASRVLGKASLVTTVSDFLGRELHAAIPGLRTPIRTMRMPLDVEHFMNGLAVPRAEPPRILYAGNVLRTKGVDVLVDAFARLRARGVPCRLRILGEGPYRAAIEQRVAALGVGADVEWSPFVGQAHMPREYGAATVTVLPTRDNAEGLGLTLAEAALGGSAVVGTRTGGIPEVVDDEVTGLLANEGDPADLARQLERVLVDAELRERFRARAIDAARERFAPAAAVSRFLEAYAHVSQR